MRLNIDELTILTEMLQEYDFEKKYELYGLRNDNRCFVITSIGIFITKQRKEIEHNLINKLGKEHASLVIKTFDKYKGHTKVYDILVSHRNKLIETLYEDSQLSEEDLKFIKTMYQERG